MRKKAVILCLLVKFGFAGAAGENEHYKIALSQPNKDLLANIHAYLNNQKICEEDVDIREYLATKAVITASEALGFYDVEVNVKHLNTKSYCLSIEVNNDNVIRWRNISIIIDGEMQNYDSFAKVWHKMLPGNRIVHEDYENAKTYIQNTALRYGFFDGKFIERKFSINKYEKVADVSLIFVSGKRWKFGDTVFSGDNILDSTLLSKFIAFEKQDNYDSVKLERTYQNLQSSNVFGNIFINSKRDDLNKQVNTDIDLAMRLPKTYTASIGYSTDVGVSIGQSLKRHWLGENGNSYGVDLYLSKPKQGLGFYYEVFGEKPITDKYRYVVATNKENFHDVFKTTYLSTGPEWVYQLSNNWIRTLSVKFHKENFEFYNNLDDHGKADLIMPSIEFSRLKFDNALNPNLGYNMQLKISAAHKSALSDTTLARAVLIHRRLHTIFTTDHRVVMRAEFGANLHREHESYSIPPSFRFFAGGDQSVRGYKYKDLSPKDSVGDSIGGNYVATGSIEYQYTFAENWRIAVFHDAGNAFMNLKQFSVKKSIGAGFRWQSPIGAFRFDIGFPMDEEDKSNKWQLHLALGSEI